MSPILPVLRRFIDNPRVRVPTLVFSGVLVVSLLERLAVFLGHGDRLEGVSGGDIIRSFAVGLRFDLVAAALLTLPLLLVMSLAPPSWLACKWFRRGVSGLSAALL